MAGKGMRSVHTSAPGVRPMHTYSIVARDPDTGEMGVAVQSNWFSVGTLCPWAEAGVGAIATQAFVNVSFGPRGLALLRQGQAAGEALAALLDADAGREMRQVGIVDARGHAAAHTGSQCVPEAGHYAGDGFTVQANLMLNDRVWPAMAEAFTGSRGPLAERLVAALVGAQEAGGDIRGQQSAALLVVRAAPGEHPWEDRLVDLRIEDHPAPVAEMARLLGVQRAYEHMNRGDQALELGDMAAAVECYRTAERLQPANREMQYWHAIALANAGQIDEALSLFDAVFAADPNWRTLTGRLPRVGLLRVEPQDMERILAQGERT